MQLKSPPTMRVSFGLRVFINSSIFLKNSNRSGPLLGAYKLMIFSSNKSFLTLRKRALPGMISCLLITAKPEKGAKRIATPALLGAGKCENSTAPLHTTLHWASSDSTLLVSWRKNISELDLRRASKIRNLLKESLQPSTLIEVIDVLTITDKNRTTKRTKKQRLIRLIK